MEKEQAIDALDKLHKEDIEDYGCEIPEGFNQDNLDRAIFAIKQLPTIQPVATDTNVGDSSEIPNSSTLQPTCNQLAIDTISRQAAIDAVNHICPVDTEYDCTLLDRVDVRCVLSDLPPIQPEPQWIPVSERLPEKSANYLVSVRWYREDDIDINVYEYNAWHKEWNDGESCGQRVIAWMPLPEPYQKGAND